MTASDKNAVLLLDIEGTTTSILFVKDILFPYARSHVKQFLESNWEEPDVKEILSELRDQVEKDIKSGTACVPIVGPDVEVKEQLETVLQNIFLQMDNDRKTTGLKSLQGKIWKSGYDDEDLKGHVYDDVPAALKRWIESGKKIYIYSSGSVQAQILLFKHTVAGDLTPFLSGYFDTTTGPKTESSSYTAIASKIKVNPEEIHFLTDIPKEAYAATEAGLKVTVMIRPDNAPLTDKESQDFNTAENFSLM